VPRGGIRVPQKRQEIDHLRNLHRNQKEEEEEEEEEKVSRYLFK
jgi:hypothetical protein